MLTILLSSPPPVVSLSKAGTTSSAWSLYYSKSWSQFIDGAMGTMLYQSGAPLGESFDALNLTSPELVSQVHRAYISAGADVIETNTFGANRAKLDAFGLGEKIREINRRGSS